MKKALCGIAALAGLVIALGTAGAEDMAFSLGQAGRPLGELITEGVIGCLLMIVGVWGLNRGEVREEK